MEAQEEEANMPIGSEELRQIRQTMDAARALVRKALVDITARNEQIREFSEQLEAKDARIAVLEQQREEQEREVAQLADSAQALSDDSDELERAIGGDGDGGGDDGAPPPAPTAT